MLDTLKAIILAIPERHRALVAVVLIGAFVVTNSGTMLYQKAETDIAKKDSALSAVEVEAIRGVVMQLSSKEGCK